MQAQIVRTQAVPGVNPHPGADGVGSAANGNSGQGTLHRYAGGFWDVLQNFAFPATVKHDVDWRLWLQGMPSYTRVGEDGEMIQNKVKQFCNFLPARLPEKLAEIFKLHWRPVYLMMEKGVGEIPDVLTPEIVNNLYNLGTDYLPRRVSYVFTKEKLHHNDWLIATWEKYLSRSMIENKGTEEDRAFLPAATYLNQPRAAGPKRRRGANAVAINRAQPERQHRRWPHTAIQVALPNNNSSTSSKDD